jgi:hypothetical protein
MVLPTKRLAKNRKPILKLRDIIDSISTGIRKYPRYGLAMERGMKQIARSCRSSRPDTHPSSHRIKEKKSRKVGALKIRPPESSLKEISTPTAVLTVHTTRNMNVLVPIPVSPSLSDVNNPLNTSLRSVSKIPPISAAKNSPTSTKSNTEKYINTSLKVSVSSP